jgi:cyclophilin family peptidyl-prolyl cis-trans isomerase
MDGFGGVSIYGDKFPDEGFELEHAGRGILSMANSGPNTNTSQFFITFKTTEWLDKKHVVFGELLEGFDVLKKIEQQGTSKKYPKVPIIIRDSGELS